MPHISIVGLGPGSPMDLTLEAWRLLEGAGEVWLRTAHHPVVADLPQGLAQHSFDSIYEQLDSFEKVYREISARVIQLGRRDCGVVYAVPGHPLVGESTVTQILREADRLGLPVKVVGGLSFIEPALTALGLDALDGVQILDALDMLSLNHPPLNPDFPALLAQVYSRAVASEVKLVLMNQYDDEHPAALIDAVGTRQQQVRRLPLYEIDRYEATPLTTLYVGPMTPVTSFEGFQQTVARLRAPEGCPWDREQTHQSLRTHLLEESYEVLEAIDGEDLDALQEELGDLLLQIVLHAQIAVEEGEFRMSDVIAQIDAKLKRRHPHVWGGIDVTGVGDVVTNWEAIKRQEREDKGDAKRSLLDSIPSALPALAQASAYTDRAGRIGFDSMEPDGVWVDLPGYLADAQRGLLCALSGATEVSSAEDAGQVLGDVLLVIADWARRHGVNAESMLREANRRFAHRFRIVEEAARASDKTLTDQRVQSLWIETGFER